MGEAITVCACNALLWWIRRSKTVFGARICLFPSTFILSEPCSFVHCQNIRTSFEQSEKMEIDRILTLEHYIGNKVFVSRERIIAFWHPGQQSKLSARDR